MLASSEQQDKFLRYKFGTYEKVCKGVILCSGICCLQLLGIGRQNLYCHSLFHTFSEHDLYLGGHADARSRSPS